MITNVLLTLAILMQAGIECTFAQVPAPAEPALPSASPAPSVGSDPTTPPLLTNESPDQVKMIRELSPAEASGEANASTDAQSVQAVEPLTPMVTESQSVETATPLISSGKKIVISLDAQAVYDDNIYFSSRNAVSDYVFVASPKLTLRLGDHQVKEETYGILNYNPEAIFFVDGTADDTLDHNVKLETQYAIAKLSIGLDARYQRLSGATPDLGDRVDRDQMSARLRLSYGWGPQLEAETNFIWNSTNYSPANLADFNEYLNETFIRYQITARTKVALGFGVGRLEVDGYGSQDFERALAQVFTDIATKLTLKLKGGVEFRQTPTGDDTTPIFALGLEYRPREGTTLSLEGYREVLASGGLPGENLTRTGVAARLKQRVGNRFIAGLDAGFDHLAYSAAGSSNGKSSSRDDSYFYVRPSLTYELREGRRLELYYMHRDNDSSVGDYSFDGNQAGLQIGWDF